MLIHELRLAGLLSFGPDSPPLPMERLNILVGPSVDSSGCQSLLLAVDEVTRLTSRYS